MAGSADRDVTALLRHLRDGDDRALDRLLPLVYGEMRALAAYHMRGERKNHTLQPTALVHEAYLRLVDRESPDWDNRAHFFGVASQVIRRILVEHAREKLRKKRGGGAVRVTLTEAALSGPAMDMDVLALDEALSRLGTEDDTAQKIVELRFFGGMTAQETATALDLSVRTVHRRWAYAKAWLYRELMDGGKADERNGS
jgi:RNA polymerase sigma-70 factor (ECF subfamily)